MAQKKNTVLRIIVPVLAGFVAVGLFFAIMTNSARSASRVRQGAPSSPASTPAAEPADEPAASPPAAAAAPSSGADVTTPDSPASGDAGVSPAAPASPAAGALSLAGLRAETVEPQPPFDPLGSIDPASAYELQLEFTPIGAGVRSVRLTHHFETIRRDRHLEIQGERRLPAAAGGEIVVAPFAALAVRVNDTTVPLTGAEAPVWRQVSPGVFEAHVVNDAGQRVLRLERAYALSTGSYSFTLTQRAVNLSPNAVALAWHQFGPVDLPQDSLTYGGDKRRVRFGYLLDPQRDPSRQFVDATDFLWPRSKALAGVNTDPATERKTDQLWPNRTAQARGYELSWAGMTNRYFGAAVHPLLDPAAPLPDKALRLAERVDRVVVPHAGPRGESDALLALRLSSGVRTVTPGGSADLSHGAYVGPLSRAVIERERAGEPLSLTGLVVYNFGGMCGPCTFTVLTGLLLWVLLVLHDYVVFDWALAVIILVFIVRTILHPVTRWSNIRIQRFGKQMQGLAPKQKKIQEKFGHDRKLMQQEMAKLWREEGVSPAGALGCLPMFLQTPVWIALYAVLYFAVELRHQGAFFGVFQAMTGGRWWFLGDLAEPDRFLYFGRTLFTLPLLGPIESLNVLPLILGVVFYIQQKYLTPPSTTLTPEQEQQQKIMKVMMVVMFPLVMYNAPSGLAVYFITNSTLGILESRYIKKHIDKYGLLEVKKKPGAAPGGFLSRLTAMAEAQRRAAEARVERRRKSRGG